MFLCFSHLETSNHMYWRLAAKLSPESPQLWLVGDSPTKGCIQTKLWTCTSRVNIGTMSIVLCHLKSQTRTDFAEWLKLMMDIASFESLIFTK